MSKYKKIEIQFKNEQSLFGALETVFGKENVRLGAGQEMQSKWYDAKNEQVDILIGKDVLAPSNAYASDMGFRKTAGGYEMLVNDMDTAIYQDRINAIKQQYAYSEVARQARSRGYAITQARAADGTITVSLKKF